jgi:hypothetical protein
MCAKQVDKQVPAPGAWGAHAVSKSWCVWRHRADGTVEYMLRADGQMRRFRSEEGANAAILVSNRNNGL